jgi:hypothetical protein
MDKSLDAALSIALAEKIKSRAKKPFDNAYKAALATEGAVYVQGFLVSAGRSRKPIEHSWLEVENCILDPNLPFLKQSPEALHYFAAHRLTVKQLKAAVDEAKEDYPEDDPLPIYGEMPYEYYGDVMLGGKSYVEAHEAAIAKCQELTERNAENN